MDHRSDGTMNWIHKILVKNQEPNHVMSRSLILFYFPISALVPIIVFAHGRNMAGTV
jgi:hypothetical protein